MGLNKPAAGEELGWGTGVAPQPAASMRKVTAVTTQVHLLGQCIRGALLCHKISSLVRLDNTGLQVKIMSP
jgi:hypothetical protein